MQQPQTQIETNKSDPMVELDIGGDSVDVELKDKENTSKVGVNTHLTNKIVHEALQFNLIEDFGKNIKIKRKWH